MIDNIFSLIEKEQQRQKETLELIPSENIVSPAVLRALGSVLTNKYSEGYPGRRYYAGNNIIDEVEKEAQKRAKEIFGAVYVNIQPYSGSPANLAVHAAICAPGETTMGLALPHGGHLTHGWSASITGQYYRSIPYHVKDDGTINIDEVRLLAHKHRPKLLWVGATAYPFQFPFETFGEIANEVGAYVAADIAHIAGLVASGLHPSPFPHVHIVTTTTHKTLRGPRGAMIMLTKKGLEKDPELPQKIDRAVFPGLQGGPHNNQTAAIAVALAEAQEPSFFSYSQQIIKNCRTLAQRLHSGGLDVIGRGDNHLLLIRCGHGRGALVEIALEATGIIVNKNTVPGETSSPFYPSGIRLGTPAVTTRGMKEAEMVRIADFIITVFTHITKVTLPEEKEQKATFLEKFQKKCQSDSTLQNIAREVKKLCQRFV